MAKHLFIGGSLDREYLETNNAPEFRKPILPLSPAPLPCTFAGSTESEVYEARKISNGVDIFTVYSLKGIDEAELLRQFNRSCQPVISRNDLR